MPLAGRVGSFKGDDAAASEQTLADAFVKIMPFPSRVRFFKACCLCTELVLLLRLMQQMEQRMVHARTCQC